MRYVVCASSCFIWHVSASYELLYASKVLMQSQCVIKNTFLFFCIESRARAHARSLDSIVVLFASYLHRAVVFVLYILLFAPQIALVSLDECVVFECSRRARKRDKEKKAAQIGPRECQRKVIARIWCCLPLITIWHLSMIVYVFFLLLLFQKYINHLWKVFDICM